MKKICVFLSLVFVCRIASAYDLKGVVRDTAGNGVAFATVSLMRADSSLVSGAITDDDGSWSLTSVDKGRYIVSASFMGYERSDRQLSVSASMNNVDFVLREEATALAEIEVETKRPLVERHIDKLVMNVAESPLAIGSNGEDLLKKAPGVNVDKDGNVTVNGRSVEVYVNDRPSYMSGDQLKAMLDGTDGNTIDKIEVITNPSSKYDAAGQGGIINIKLRKNATKGLFGTVSAQYGGMYFKSIGKYLNDDRVSLNLNYRTDKTYTNISIFQAFGQFAGISESTTKQNVAGKEMVFKSRSQFDDVNFQYYMLRVSNDFMIDDKNTLGFIFQSPVMLSNMNIPMSNNESVTTIDGIETEHSQSSLNSKMYSPQHTANLNYTHVFDPNIARELTVNIDYNRNNSSSVQANAYKYLDGSNLALNINNHQILDLYSAKIDFQTLFWQTAMLECGAKWAMTRTRNTMITDSIGISENNETRFDYQEQIAALHISVGKQFNQHWSAKLGLRGEMTYSRGNWLTLDTVTGGKPYFNLFPTAYVGYAPTEKWSMSASYTRRIGRPNYYQLNPFVRYEEAHSFEVGNPELKPDFSNMVQLTFAYSRYVSLTFDFSNVKDMRSSESSILPNGDLMSTYSNFGSSTSHSMTLAATEVPIVHIKSTDRTWLTMTLNATASHEINRSGSYARKSWTGSVYGSLTADLPSDWKISFDAYWSAPRDWGYYNMSGNVYTSLAVKKQLLKKTLTIGLTVSDLLRSSLYEMNYQGDADLKSKSDYCQQRINLSLSYNFGKAEYHKYRRVGNIDESSRMGSGEGSMGGGMGK
ncbi:MAG: TonB-dependent receptor [Paludibacteraceae bacterium]|nr:TonB-dependent receptor [Paludibacteraceae bacterium]